MPFHDWSIWYGRLEPGLQTALGGGGTKAQGTVGRLGEMFSPLENGDPFGPANDGIFPNPNRMKQLLKLSLWNDTVRWFRNPKANHLGLYLKPWFGTFNFRKEMQ